MEEFLNVEDHLILLMRALVKMGNVGYKSFLKLMNTSKTMRGLLYPKRTYFKNMSILEKACTGYVYDEPNLDNDIYNKIRNIINDIYLVHISGNYENIKLREDVIMHYMYRITGSDYFLTDFKRKSECLRIENSSLMIAKPDVAIHLIVNFPEILLKWKFIHVINDHLREGLLRKYPLIEATDIYTKLIPKITGSIKYCLFSVNLFDEENINKYVYGNVHNMNKVKYLIVQDYDKFLELYPHKLENVIIYKLLLGIDVDEKLNYALGFNFYRNISKFKKAISRLGEPADVSKIVKFLGSRYRVVSCALGFLPIDPSFSEEITILYHMRYIDIIKNFTGLNLYLDFPVITERKYVIFYKDNCIISKLNKTEIINYYKENIFKYDYVVFDIHLSDTEVGDIKNYVMDSNHSESTKLCTFVKFLNKCNICLSPYCDDLI